MKPRAVVVGAGIGGLATALRLACRGHQVTVLEAADTYGGKLGQHREAGHRFDRGPSLFTMPELLMELESMVPMDHPRRPVPFEFHTLDRSTHYFWEDEPKPLVAWSDTERFADDVEARWDVPRNALLGHLDSSAEAFDLTRGVFLEQSLHERATYRSPAAWRLLRRAHRLPLIGTLHRSNHRALKHPKLVQLFDRYATYNGSDPHRAPAMLHVIPHLEHGIGTFLPKKGMRSIPEHVAALALSMGVDIQCNTRARQILHDAGKVTGVLDERGTTHDAQVVVSNADLHPTYRALMPDLPAPERILSQERSTSGVIFYWGVKGIHPELHLHNILFSKDYEAEFANIADQGSPAPDPTVYINITSKVIPEDAPEGEENWFVLTNVSADPEAWTPEAIQALKEAVLAKIERTLGFKPDIACEQILTPQGIQDATSSWRGALYGASSNSTAAAFLRHRNRSTQLSGLYFCGGSVHPGGGIPLCLLGARIVDELVQAHHPQ